ncbi:MAG: thioredoxin family protein [Deltaproteobacteria bacterium]|nr:thioredoxin family protein [Deltaproteobacteria bacterium]MBW2152607.1 thioredoxin family protein [Deltaproteobacteria bacterium]
MNQIPMKPKEKTIIRRWNDELAHGIEIGLQFTNDRRSAAFKRFGEEISHLAPKVRIQKIHTDSDRLPAIQIGKNIRYHAVPLGRELEPFLATLSLLSDPSKRARHPELEKINRRTALTLYIALECSFCPQAVRKLTPLAIRNPLVELSIIDAAVFEDLAKKDRIGSVPTVVLDGLYRWTGNPPVAEIIKTMIHRSPLQLSAETLESMLKQGEAEQVAAMMIRHGSILPAFIDLLTHEKWSLRLGAMVTMEFILEKNEDLAVQAVNLLLDRIQVLDDSVKGDVVYLLGKIGNDAIISKLESLLTGSDNPELKEAVAEAVDRIKSKEVKFDSACSEDEGTCGLPDFLKS